MCPVVFLHAQCTYTKRSARIAVIGGPATRRLIDFSRNARAQLVCQTQKTLHSWKIELNRYYACTTREYNNNWNRVSRCLLINCRPTLALDWIASDTHHFKISTPICVHITFCFLWRVFHVQRKNSLLVPTFISSVVSQFFGLDTRYRVNPVVLL